MIAGMIHLYYDFETFKSHVSLNPVELFQNPAASPPPARPAATESAPNQPEPAADAPSCAPPHPARPPQSRPPHSPETPASTKAATATSLPPASGTPAARSDQPAAPPSATRSSQACPESPATASHIPPHDTKQPTPASQTAAAKPASAQRAVALPPPPAPPMSACARSAAQASPPETAGTTAPFAHKCHRAADTAASPAPGSKAHANPSRPTLRAKRGSRPTGQNTEKGMRMNSPTIPHHAPWPDTTKIHLCISARALLGHGNVSRVIRRADAIRLFSRLIP